MPANRLINPRTEILKLEIGRLINKLESPTEIDFAIGMLTARRQELQKVQTVAVESRAREFLNKRWTIFGPQFEGPWRVGFAKPVTVRWTRAGIDFSTHLAYEDIHVAEVTEAWFVRLGRSRLSKYVELKVPVTTVLKHRADRERYGLNDDEEVYVYCTLYQLIQKQPMWILDVVTAAKIGRLQAIARDTVASAVATCAANAAIVGVQ